MADNLVRLRVGPTLAALALIIGAVAAGCSDDDANGVVAGMAGKGTVHGGAGGQPAGVGHGGETTSPGGAPARCSDAGSAPRLLAPGSFATASVRRPEFRWSAPAEGAELLLCRDRGCTDVIEAVAASCKSAARPAEELPAGPVFWRVKTPQASSVTWVTRLRSRSAPAETAWGLSTDFDGDGFGDVAVGAPITNGSGRVYIFRGGASGTETDPSNVLDPPLESADFGSALAVAGDVNGDGYADLVVVDVKNGLPLYYGSASGLATTPVLLGTPVGAGVAPTLAGVGDVDRDGFGDLLTDFGGSRFTLIRGTAADPVSATMDLLPGAYRVFAAGDFNGDGFADVAAPGNESEALLLPGGASASLGKALRLRTDTPATDFASYIGPGDFDGDGYPDLLAAPNTIFAGGPNPASPVPAAMQLANNDVDPVSPGDVDGDGYDDVLAGGKLFRGSAAGLDKTSATEAMFQPRPVGDLNGDGRSDVAEAASGAVRIYYGATTGLVAGPVLEAPAGDERRFGSTVAGCN